MKWTTYSRVFAAVVSLVNLAVMVRLLDKADFGLMALAQFILGFMDLFLDMGISSAILFYQNITKREYSTLYWLNWGISIILFILLCLFAPLMAAFYDEPRLTLVIQLLATILLFSGLGRQYRTVLQKELNFRTMALGRMSGVGLSLIVGVGSALAGFGVYSLVFAGLTKAAVSNIVYFIMGIRREPLLFHFNFQESQRFLRVGGWEVLGNLANYFNRELDTLLIGKFLGAEALGSYTLVKQLVKKPMTVLNPIVTQVATPYLAKVQAKGQEMRDNYLLTVQMVMGINVPIYLLLILLSYPVIYLYYGAEYTYLTPIAQVYALYILFRVMGNPVGSLLVANGRTDLSFYWNLAMLIVYPLFILVGIQGGIFGASLSLLLMMIVLFVPGWYFLIRPLIGVSLKDYAATAVPQKKTYTRIVEGVRRILKKRSAGAKPGEHSTTVK